MAERIDAHHHLWRYSADQYDWIDDRMHVLQRDFLPGDLEAAAGQASMDGTIAVQARQSIEETEWLLSLAGESTLIRGVVGWAPLMSDNLGSVLDRLRANHKLKGLRHVVQAEPDDDFILRSDFNRGLASLLGTGLVYDILIFERHLPQTIQFVDRHPQQVFVLDHIAKPAIAKKQLEPWRSNLLELAKRENVYCKVSGMVTEADWTRWSDADLRPYWDTVLQCFGPERLMFGSDWPVCLVASSYERWLQTVAGWTNALTSSGRDSILGETAKKVYGLAKS